MKTARKTLPAVGPYRAVKKVSPRRLKEGDVIISKSRHCNDWNVYTFGRIEKFDDPRIGDHLRLAWMREPWQEVYEFDGRYLSHKLEDYPAIYLCERDPAAPAAELFERLQETRKYSEAATAVFDLLTGRTYNAKAVERAVAHCEADAEMIRQQQEMDPEATEKAMLALLRGLEAGDRYAIRDAQAFLGSKGYTV